MRGVAQTKGLWLIAVISITRVSGVIHPTHGAHATDKNQDIIMAPTAEEVKESAHVDADSFIDKIGDATRKVIDDTGEKISGAIDETKKKLDDAIDDTACSICDDVAAWFNSFGSAKAVSLRDEPVLTAATEAALPNELLQEAADLLKSPNHYWKTNIQRDGYRVETRPTNGLSGTPMIRLKIQTTASAEQAWPVLLSHEQSQRWDPTDLGYKVLAQVNANATLGFQFNNLGGALPSKLSALVPFKTRVIRLLTVKDDETMTVVAVSVNTPNKHPFPEGDVPVNQRIFTYHVEPSESGSIIHVLLQVDQGRCFGRCFLNRLVVPGMPPMVAGVRKIVENPNGE